MIEKSVELARRSIDVIAQIMRHTLEKKPVLFKSTIWRSISAARRCGYV
jgi:hypothetical protein